MKPAVYNINPSRNADFFLGEPLRFKDSTGAAINLTGWTVVAQVWDLPNTTKLADFTVTYTNRVAGEVSLSLPYTITAALPKECAYDVMLIDPSSKRQYYLEGTCTMDEGYTKP